MQSKKEIENKEELLKQISKEQYGDEYFIDIAILNYERQQEKTYTFFRDNKQIDLLRKYNFCQRPDSSSMDLCRFTKNGEIEGWMSESLAEEFGLVKIDLNEFVHEFVKLIIKKNIQLETDKQKLIEKLQEDKLKINEKIKDNIKIINKEWPCKEHLSMNDYFKRKNKLIRENEVLKTKIEYLQEILKILKGENDE